MNGNRVYDGGVKTLFAIQHRAGEDGDWSFLLVTSHPLDSDVDNSDVKTHGFTFSSKSEAEDALALIEFDDSLSFNEMQKSAQLSGLVKKDFVPPRICFKIVELGAIEAQQRDLQPSVEQLKGEILDHLTRIGSLCMSILTGEKAIAGRKWSLGHYEALNTLLLAGLVKPRMHSGMLGSYVLTKRKK